MVITAPELLADLQLHLMQVVGKLPLEFIPRLANFFMGRPAIFNYDRKTGIVTLNL